MNTAIVIPKSVHSVQGPKSTIHIPTITMVYTRSLNNQMAFDECSAWWVHKPTNNFAMMFHGGVFITDDIDYIQRQAAKPYLGDKRILVSHRGPNPIVPHEDPNSFEAGDLGQAIHYAMTEFGLPIWIAGSPTLLREAEGYVDFVRESIVMTTSSHDTAHRLLTPHGFDKYRPNAAAGNYKYEGPKVLKNFNFGHATLTGDEDIKSLTPTVVVCEHRVYATDLKHTEKKWTHTF